MCERGERITPKERGTSRGHKVVGSVEYLPHEHAPSAHLMTYNARLKSSMRVLHTKAIECGCANWLVVGAASRIGGVFEQFLDHMSKENGVTYALLLGVCLRVVPRRKIVPGRKA